MIIAVLAVKILLGTVCSIFAQSDMDKVLGKAQKSLDQNSKNVKSPSIEYTKETKPIDYSNYKTYENLTHGVNLKYPKAWQVTYQPADYYESFPDTIFNVALLTPEKGAFEGVIMSINIEGKPSAQSLTEYKNQIATNLKGGYPDIKEVTVFTDTLAGEPAYRIENMVRVLDHWEKSIDLGFIKEGKLYKTTFGLLLSLSSRCSA